MHLWTSLLNPPASDGTFIEQELIFIVAILIIAAVALVVRRIKLPYTVALVIVGLALAFFPLPVDISVTNQDTSNLILSLLVPPLIFEAALHLGWKKLKKNLLPIFLMAAPGVLIATFIVGFIVNRTLGVPMASALAFGALISATDPVAVVAFFRSLGVSERLSALVEGESLLNDGIAIVIFSLAVSVSQTGETIGLAEGVFDFILVSFGGLGIGLAFAVLIGEILKRVDEHLIETTLTMALAFGAYVFAELAHVSGILSVVAAGLYIGSFGVKTMSPTTKIALNNFWELLAFLANSIIFLLIGLQITVTDLFTNISLLVISVLAIVISRALVVYPMTWLSARLNHAIPSKYRHIMFWGGLRGAVSLALALTLTGPYSNQLRLMTFEVVLFTLLVQGTTIEMLINRLGLSKISQNLLDQFRLTSLFESRAGSQELDRLQKEGFLPHGIWRSVSNLNKQETQDLLEECPDLEQQILIETRQEMLKASRLAVADAFRRNVIAEQVYRQKIEDIDKRIAVWKLIESSFEQSKSAPIQITEKELSSD